MAVCSGDANAELARYDGLLQGIPNQAVSIIPTLCVGTHPKMLSVNQHGAERHKLGSHAEHGNHGGNEWAEVDTP